MLNSYCPNHLIQAGSQLLRLWLLLLILCPMPAAAVVMENLYEVTLPVPDETRRVRNAALADGLAEVLIRVSGDSAILQKLNPPNSRAYVKQFRYINADDPAAQPAESGDADIKLLIQYNPTRIMDLLRSKSIPIWGNHRSEVVMWIAVRDGVNQYVLRGQDNSPIKDQLEQSMARRGIPVKWPRYDRQDKQSLRFADIWAGFRDPLLAASQRYGRGAVVSGSLSWNGREWIADWTLLTNRNFRWGLRGPGYESIIAQATDRFADEVGKYYAVVETMDASNTETVQLDIDSIHTLDKFVKLQNYLTSLPAVQQVGLSRIQQGHARFNIALRSKVEDFLRLIETGAVLQAVDDEPKPLDSNNQPLYQFHLN